MTGECLWANLTLMQRLMSQALAPDTRKNIGIFLKIDVRALTISASVGAFLSIVLSLCCQRTRLAAGTSKWTISPSVLDAACMVLMESADDEGISGTAVISPTWPPPSDDRPVPPTLSELLV